MTGIEKGIIAAIAVILGVIVLYAIGMAKEKERFLAECSQHEKPYECEVKWKQMHPDAQHVVVTGFVAR